MTMLVRWLHVQIILVGGKDLPDIVHVHPAIVPVYNKVKQHQNLHAEKQTGSNASQPTCREGNTVA